jgi:hypothetical protein
MTPIDLSDVRPSTCWYTKALNTLECAQQVHEQTHALLPVYMRRGSPTDWQTLLTEKEDYGDGGDLAVTAQRGLAEELGVVASRLIPVPGCKSAYVAGGLVPFAPDAPGHVPFRVDSLRRPRDVRTVRVLPVGTYEELRHLMSGIHARSTTSSESEMRTIGMVCITPLARLARGMHQVMRMHESK